MCNNDGVTVLTVTGLVLMTVFVKMCLIKVFNNTGCSNSVGDCNKVDVCNSGCV